MDNITIKKVYDSRLTIKEIDTCKKCSDICLKVSVIGSIISGINLLISFMVMGIIPFNDSLLWRIIEVLTSLILMCLGFTSCEVSRDALLARDELINIINQESILLNDSITK